ncbi:LysE family translocator [Acinetobacter pollinis]|uniref:LysE family translocator n=1 Tax=Acinetobacter pollinis TaxID=2605270 RepID=A0ABU6DUH1_9GAMM|nr:LysE family translocator [Acinetobacter pollinis]MEB5477111.1 LysE family translocator [Acinetobacter pollinis]
MNWLELLSYIITVVVMIAVPGPVMLLVASAGLKGGYVQALKTIFGTNTASLVLIVTSICILKGIFTLNMQFFILFKLLGCLYIAYLGYKTLKDAKEIGNKEKINQIFPQAGGFKKGFLVGISNPKDIIFFSAFFPQFVNVTSDINMSLMVLIVLWIILDFLTLSIVYMGFNRLSKSRHYSKTLYLCGMILIFIAIYGAITSLT